MTQVSASLTLGGYDASRFHASDITHQFADDNSRDLVVGIQSILILDSPLTLLPTPILSFVDATVSHIWLPLEACQAFETAFGIEHDDESDLYLVNETTHQALVARNATLVFTIGTDLISTEVVNITLPYATSDDCLSEREECYEILPTEESRKCYAIHPRQNISTRSVSLSCWLSPRHSYELEA